jgi:hypothetical protein
MLESGQASVDDFYDCSGYSPMHYARSNLDVLEHLQRGPTKVKIDIVVPMSSIFVEVGDPGLPSPVCRRCPKVFRLARCPTFGHPDKFCLDYIEIDSSMSYFFSTGIVYHSNVDNNTTATTTLLQQQHDSSKNNTTTTATTTTTTKLLAKLQQQLQQQQ